ncbi:RING-H2 finger protein ATL39-like [Lotus japonicus]|uniref:RING-H2 finger protein ATL39-like n=1 Tax=Lotus japonicus TaxID=34305 RepID=UPI0025873A0C|nr:RING-H2 finger protein ATL39-like [Lotus japonicus]
MFPFPAILILGAFLIALTFFTLTMLGWCCNTNPFSPPPPSFADKISGFMSLESHSITFMYKEAEAATTEGTNQTECVICLTAFQEDESVRKLHSCKHIFHTCCIDKWLGSQTGCPLCRTQIDKVASPKGTGTNNEMITVIVNS